MSNKVKKFILYFFIYFGLVPFATIFLALPICDAFSYDMPVRTYEIVLATCLGIMIFCVIMFLTLGSIWHIDEEKIKAQKTQIHFKDAATVEQKIDEYFQSNNYIRKTDTFSDSAGTVSYFFKNTPSTVKCFVYTNSKELQKQDLLEINQKFKIHLDAFNNKKTLRKDISILTLACVQHVTPAFYSLVDGRIENTLKETYYYAGYSFGGEILYLQNFKDGRLSRKSKALKEILLALLN